MMHRVWIAIAFVCSAGAAFALQNADPRMEVVAKGEIVAVAAEEGTISLEETPDWSSDAMQRGVMRTFAINEATKLTDGDERVELSDIDVGAPATIRYLMDDGRNVAISVEVRSRATE